MVTGSEDEDGFVGLELWIKDCFRVSGNGMEIEFTLVIVVVVKVMMMMMMKLKS